MLNTPGRRLIRFMLSLKIPILRRRVGRLVMERIDGVPFMVLPDVFNPVVFRSSVFYGRTIAASPLCCPACEQVEDGAEPRALDMGTGTGVGAIFAARRGYRTVAVDINPEAVRCARINALLNHLEDRIEVRQGDLFAPVCGERFDLVLFNPPFYRGVPKSPLDMAWRSPDVFERFAEGLPGALKPRGRALILLSTDGDPDGMLSALRANRLVVSAIAERDYGNEIMTVYAVSLLE